MARSSNNVKAVILFGALNYAMLGGLLYCFGILATDIKTLHELSQLEINLIGSIVYTVGLGSQLPVSYIAKFTSMRAISIAGAFFNIIGWGLLLVANIYSPANVAWVGIGWAFVGLGVSSGSLPTLLLMNTHFETEQAQRWNNTIYIMLYGLIAAIISPIYSLIEASIRDKLLVTSAVSVGLSIFVMIYFIAFMYPKTSDQQVQINEGETTETTLLLSEPQVQMTFVSATMFFATKLSFWVLFVILFFSFGDAVNFYNTSGSVALSLGATEEEIGILFVIFGAVQTAGRFCSGLLFSFLSQHHKPPLLVLLILIGFGTVMMGSTSLAASFVNSPTLMYVYLAINSYAYGALWYLIIELSNEYQTFVGGKDAKRVPTLLLYGLLCFAPAFGPIVFDSLSGSLYDNNAQEDNLCVGLVCYSTYFLICGIGMSVISGLTVLLYFSIPKKEK